jgi:hypothetical protein
MRPGLGPLRPRGRATPLAGWAGGAATRPDGPGVTVLKPKVVELTEKRAKIEILPNVFLRVKRNDIKAINGRVVLFRNPISQLNCIAYIE